VAEARYAYFPVFLTLERGAAEAESLAFETERFFKEWEDRVTVRGFYSTGGFDAAADLMMWWVADSPEDVQEMTLGFLRTPLGRELQQTHAFLGVHRPPETAPDHLPAFLRGEPPRKYLCVYPFVRTPEWYLLAKEERSALLAEHGEMGREFPGVLPNTTSAFGLGDWEWILAFEADDLVELVDCIRRLRDSKSRLFVKTETPFVTGIRKDLAEVIRDVV
jgi:hydrogen peroxide-dependent heme synthase